MQLLQTDLTQMSGNRLITLLTDFGAEDAYVGVMKGVIAQINPTLSVIDLTHQIPPQNIALASFQLLNAYPHFPQGTVHVAVVDPGVGSHRRAIAIQTETAYLVGPDNGIFSGVLQRHPAIAAVELTHVQYWYTAQPSTTFHGRDIFAPVAAHLASGVPLTDLGLPVALTDLHRQSLPDCQLTDQGAIGVIQAIDHFGNLITNIPGTAVNQQSWMIRIGDRHIPGRSTYSSCPVGDLLGLIGSHGWVEIAIHGGHAQQLLQQQLGAAVELLLDPIVSVSNGSTSSAE